MKCRYYGDMPLRGIIILFKFVKMRKLRFWNNIAPILILLSLLVVYSIPISVLAQSHDSITSVSEDYMEKIRIGVLFIDTPTGKRHWEGIEEAVEGHALADRILLRPHSYINENQGLDFLMEMVRDISDTAVAVILGPTESGVFVRAFARQEELSSFKVPVISGLVTANVANDKDGWFFRTNMDVTRRVHAITDFLNKHWIRSIAVLYATTEFGRRAELAFENYLRIRRPGQLDQYISLAYESPPNPRPQLDEILDNRPEAVGFFGEREDIEQIYPLLQEMNQGIMPYKPLFFTILDVRHMADSVANIYFVSVTEVESSLDRDHEEYDDVKALGYDTAILVLNELQKLQPMRRLSPEERHRFRDQFAALLNRSGPHENTKTNISFNNFENSTRQHIFNLVDGQLKPVEIAKTFGWYKKIWHKVTLVYAIYGWLPYICVCVLLIIAVVISSMDVANLYRGSKIKFYKSWVFYLFMIAHFVVAISLYIFFAENGTIRYSNIFAVVAIGLAPFTLLRTTFFQTHKGRAISLEPLYKKVLSILDAWIMRSLYKALHARINIIAYHNPQDKMIKALEDYYIEHRNETEGDRLLQEFKEELASEPSYFNRRRICARRLLRIHGWDGVKAEGLIPPDLDDENLPDPQQEVWKLAKEFAPDPQKVGAINRTIKKLMEQLKVEKPKRHAELKDFRDYELDKVLAAEGELNVNIRFLFTLFSFDEQRLRQELGEET